MSSIENEKRAGTMDAAVHILPVSGMPEISPGDDLDAMLGDALGASTGGLEAGDVVVVTHRRPRTSLGRRG